MNKRYVSLLFVSLAFALAATPMMAACRFESALPIGSILDLTNTHVIQTQNKIAAIIFAVNKPTQGFVCNGDGGVNPLPAGCTTDGFSPKSAFSSNVASATQSPTDCKIFSVVTTTSGPVKAGFRIRFEENRQTPARKTFVVLFNMPAGFRLPVDLPFTIQPVVDPLE